MIRFYALAALCLALPSCAKTMTAAQCSQADWRAIGFEDGSTGAPSTALADRAAACGAGGQSIDQTAYTAGRVEGLRSYCTFESGYSDGYARRKYKGVCPVQTAAAFRQGYEQGQADRRAYYATPRIGIGVGIGSGGRVGVGTTIGIGY